MYVCMYVCMVTFPCLQGKHNNRSMNIFKSYLVSIHTNGLVVKHLEDTRFEYWLQACYPKWRGFVILFSLLGLMLGQ